MGKNIEAKKLIGKIAQKGNRKNYIVVQKVTPYNEKATSFIDVRSFFTNAAGAIRPTQRGVRIYSDIAVDVVATILNALTQEELEAVMAKTTRIGLPHTEG